jgi:hypothetical protein
MVWQERVLLAPATLTGVVGLGYAIYRHRHFD